MRMESIAETATATELSAAWKIHVKQIWIAIRQLGVPSAGYRDKARVYNREQQQLIADHLEFLASGKQRVQSLESELRDEQLQRARTHLATTSKFHEVYSDIAAFKQALRPLEETIPVLAQKIIPTLNGVMNAVSNHEEAIEWLTGYLGELHEQYKARLNALTEHINTLVPTVTAQENRLEALEALLPSLKKLALSQREALQRITALEAQLTSTGTNFGSFAVIAERRLQALEDGTTPTDDPILAEARRRGRQFLDATEQQVTQAQAADILRGE